MKEQQRISRELDLPILKRLAHVSEEQLLDMGMNSMRETLSYLGEGRCMELIELLLNRWRTGQTSMIGKSDLVAEDITLINFIRGQALRSFISRFTNEIEVVLLLVNELDSFFTGTTTAALNTYIQILHEEISKHETALLQAQHIAGIGSFEWDLITNHTNKSPETDRIFGIGRDDFKIFMHHVYPADRKHVAKAMARSLVDGNYECEFRFQNNGILKTIWAKGAVTFQEANPIKFVGIVQDITERKKAEQELMEKKIALERSNESLQQFAFVASHDLQEPMRQISTFADIVLNKEENLSEASRSNLQKVVKYAIRMRQMIDDILAYSTLTQWEGREQFNLGEILQVALENLAQSITEKNAAIEYHNLPEIHAVPSQIQQLFQNLISNALKFSRPDIQPTVTISFEWRSKDNIGLDKITSADQFLQLRVQDNGIGFEQQFASKIFGLFSRLHNKKDYQGTGLGLAIAKKIVDNHGGVISASSVKGTGTTFTIVLPQ